MNLKPYPEYKDSGVEWIGEIPERWVIFRLKHVVNEFISGGTPRSDNEKFWAQHEEEGIPWVAIGDMTNNDLVTDTKKKITVDGLADKNLRILNKGTLIYSIFASLGKVSVLGIDATTNQAILGLISSKKIDNSFLKYYLRYLEDPIIVLSNANTQNNLNSTIVKNIEFSLPTDLNEQFTISSFLDRKTSEIDLTIEKDTQLIELLKEKRTALINHVVTKGLDPTVKMKDSGVEWIGEIPEDWEALPLFALFNERKVKNIRNREENVLSLSYGRIVRRNVETNFGLLPESFETYNIVEPGCIVLRLTDLQNDKKSLRTGLVKEKGIITSAYLSLEKRKDFDVSYVHYLLHAFDLVKVFYSLGGGVRQSMRYEDMKKMPLLYPPIEEQVKISSYIDKKTDKIDDFILKISKHINLLEEYKKSLIHHVVTGKVDVREVAV